jgi:hypothetical protein
VPISASPCALQLHARRAASPRRTAPARHRAPTCRTDATRRRWHREFVDRQLPLQRRGADQRSARRRRGQAHHLPGIGMTLDEPPVALMPSSRATLPTTQRPALARPKPSSRSVLRGWKGRLPPASRRCRRWRRCPPARCAPRQRHVQFLGREHRQRGVHALPHLAARHGQHHGAIGPILIQPFSATSPSPAAISPGEGRGASAAAAPPSPPAGRPAPAVVPAAGAPPHAFTPPRA